MSTSEASLDSGPSDTTVLTEDGTPSPTTLTPARLPTGSPGSTARWLLAGDAIFTVEIPLQYRAGMPEHYTYRLTRVDANNGWPEAVFCKLLAGPDNTSDYVYMGKLNGQVCVPTKRSMYKLDSPPVKLLNRLLYRLFRDELDVVEKYGFKLYHIGRCGACGRALTTPDSVERGIGPVCAGRMGIL